MVKLNSLKKFLKISGLYTELGMLNSIIKNAQGSLEITGFIPLPIDNNFMSNDHPLSGGKCTFRDILQYIKHPGAKGSEETISKIIEETLKKNENSGYVDITIGFVNQRIGNNNSDIYNDQDSSTIKVKSFEKPFVLYIAKINSFPDSESETSTESGAESSGSSSQYYYPFKDRDKTYVSSKPGVKRKVHDKDGKLISDGPHGGADIAPNSENATEEFEVYPIARGVVVRSYYSDSLGFAAFVLHDEGPDSNNKYTYSVYGHLEAMPVAKGTIVEPNGNTPIGKMGNTGHATGKHLHLEILTVDASTVDAYEKFEANGQNYPDFEGKKDGNLNTSFNVENFI